MPDEEEPEDEESSSDRFSSFSDDGADGELDFDGDEGEDAGSPHSESTFLLDDVEAGRETFLGPASYDLERTEAQAAFADDLVNEAANPMAGEAPTFADADPTALDAASGLSSPKDLDAALDVPKPNDADARSSDASNAPQESLSRRHLRGLLEALLLVSDQPMKVADLAAVARAETKEVRSILEELAIDYRDSSRGFQLD
ncbi:MAG: hypothetical protein NVS3B20_03410 [Polyangiales bacterium]